MRGGSVGVVEFSRHPDFAPGDPINCALVPGWAQWGVVDPATLIRIKPRAGISLRAFVGVLGGTGLTAYFGLLRVGRPKAGDVVVVTAAAGAVGSVAAQIAKHVVGCRVVGVAGGEAKCEFLRRRLGLDEAVDYKRPDFEMKLRAAVGPTGADVCFDNVGGVVLDALLKNLAQGARVVLCGAVSGMNAPARPLGNVMNLIVKSARMEGFVLLSYASEYTLAQEEISSWILDGRVSYVEDVVIGLERAPRAMLRLFGEAGGTFGKLVVVLHPESERPESSDGNASRL